VTGHATAGLTVGGVSLTRSTDGVSPNSDDAVKTFVDAKITIAEDATNEVGDPHTFTVTVWQDAGDGSGFVKATVGNVDVTLTDSNGAVSVLDATASTCDDGQPSGDNLDSNGQCTVVFTSNSAGQVTGHATAGLTVGGVSLTRSTDGVSPNSDDAVKTFVDAYITIAPNGTNGITESHTFTVTVFEDDGSGGGFVAAVGETVTASISGTGSITGGTCTGGGTTDGSGQCTVIVYSATAGVGTVHAASDVSVGGITVHRETDGTGNNSGDATKTWVDGSLTWIKHDNKGQLLGGATFEVCRTFDRFGIDIADECVTIVDDTDGVDDTTGDRDGTPGEFRLDELVLGTYTIRETVPPPGYTGDAFVDTVVLTLAAPDGAATHIWVNTPPSQGCTPGFFKHWTNVWDDATDAIPTAITAYVLADGDPLTVLSTDPGGGPAAAGTTWALFRETFGITPAQMTAAGLDPDLTLEEAINTGGGGFEALLRHATAGLLSSVSVDYTYSVGYVIDGVQAAFANGDANYNGILDALTAANNLNESACPKSDPSD
jgi:hypothetical protein